jgi:S1-C subfamily serine protease
MGLLVGGLAFFYINYVQISNLNRQVTNLQNQLSALSGSGNFSVTNQTVTIFQNGTNLADLYGNVSSSVVLIQGTTSTGSVQGSGFVYNYLGQMVVITNFHVVSGTTERSVTFSNGHGYASIILGTDAYADLAVLSVDTPADEFEPVDIVSSSSLRVGDEVIAIGNPYGLVGSLTTGVVSALGRTIKEDNSNFSIAKIIQTSTPINPGNSGGPLLNAVGKVVGITTAIVSDSQGLGFAIPSDTLLREIRALMLTGSYAGHSYMGIFGGDMTYDRAQQLHASVTYGWYVDSTVSGGPSGDKLQHDDIIVALNGTTIKSNDDLASYLEAKTLPGDTVAVTVVRNNSTDVVNVKLGQRPTP